MVPDHKINPKLNEKLVSNAYDGFYYLLIGETITIILYVFILWNQISNRSVLILWLITIFAINVVSRCIIISIYYYQKRNLKSQNFIFWRRYFIFNNIIAGILWGLGGLLFIYVDDPYYRMVIFIVLTGLMSAPATKLMIFSLSNFGFITPICIVLLLLSVSILPSIENILFFGTLLYVGYIFYGSISAHNTLVETIYLHFEIEDLLNNLSNTHSALQKSEETLVKIFENAPIGMALVNPEGKWLQVNNSLCDIVGYNKNELQNINFQEITYKEDLSEDLKLYHEVLQNKRKNYQLEKRYVNKNGEIIWVLLTTTLLRDEDGKPLYFISQIQDINERKANESIMADLNDQTNAMLVELKQREYEISLVNKTNDLLQVCQNTSEAYSAINMMAKKFFPHLSGGIASYNNVHNKMETKQQWGKKQILQDEFVIQDCWGLRKGQMYLSQDTNREMICHHFTSQPNSYICLPLLFQNRVIGMLCLLNESITDHEKQLAITFSEVIKLSLANIQLRDVLRDIGLHDTLTGLYNRRYLDETLERELIRTNRLNNMLCIAMIDIDFFKRVNDTYGHDAGDVVLKYLGKLLKDNFRGNDIACRYGGEEFILILMDTSMISALPRIKSICDEFKGADITFNNQHLSQITISVGMAEAPTHGTTVNDLIHAADTALYSAKHRGRDRIEFYEKSNPTEPKE